MEHTPGPWRWLCGENGAGSDATVLVGGPDNWVKCDYWCFGWEEGSHFSRGPLGTPGHEHNQAPHILGGTGWHGSGDLDIEIESLDARLIAAAPELLEALQIAAPHLQHLASPDLGRYKCNPETCPKHLVDNAIAKATCKN